MLRQRYSLLREYLALGRLYRSNMDKFWFVTWWFSQRYFVCYANVSHSTLSIEWTVTVFPPLALLNPVNLRASLAAQHQMPSLVLLSYRKISRCEFADCMKYLKPKPQRLRLVAVSKSS